MADPFKPVTIHLAVAFDQNYFSQFFALATSVFHHHQGKEIAFHAIATGITAENLIRIQEYINHQESQISFYEIDDLEVNKLVLLNKWTSAVYYRLYFPFLLPQSITRFLYLDMDTIVVNPLHDLWGMNLESFPLAAVYDNYVKLQPLLGIYEEGEYFNSGVLLINRPPWSEQKISERTIDFLKSNPEKIKFVDQCGLNAVLHKNWLKLESKYNFIYSSVPSTASMRELRKLVGGLVVIHFTLQRPWHMLCRNRLAYLYFQYLKLSPLGREASHFTDFSFLKVPEFLKIKLLHLYFDWPWLAVIWRRFKKSNHDKTINSPSA